MNKTTVPLASLFTLAALLGCTDNTSSQATVAQAKTPTVIPLEKSITLKDLAIGKPIKSIKAAKKFSDNMYMFDYEYFGERRSIRATTNDAGLITKYEITFGRGFDSLKSALEEKLSADNARQAIFECSSNKIKPDSSAKLETRVCKIASQNEVLKISETKMQPTAKVAGIPQLPTVITSIELVGIIINTEAEVEKKKAADTKQREIENKRKSDI